MINVKPQYADHYYSLNDVASRDPDGGEVEPTTAHYLEFKAWVIYHYGKEVWRIYSSQDWAKTPEV